MGFSGEDIKSELKNLKSHLEKLPEEIKLYRIISVDNKEDINTKFIGSHYSHSKKDLVNSHNFTTGYGEKKFLITKKLSFIWIRFIYSRKFFVLC